MFFQNHKISVHNNFDFLRFLFALLVVCAHTIALSELNFFQKSIPINFAHLSYLAICGFFVISGFLVTKSFLSSANITAYFIKRAKRIYPGYLTVILLSVIFLVALSTLSFAAYFSSPGTYLYVFWNVIFLNFVHPQLPEVFTGNAFEAVNGALWTIKVEVGFYLLLPLIIALTNKFKYKDKALFFLILIYVLSVAFRLSMNFAGARLNNETILALGRQIPGFLSYFLSGSVLFVLYQPFLKHKKLIALIAFIIFVLEFSFRLEVLSPAALACIVIYAAFSFPALNNFGKYGDISYGIYIFHFPIIQSLVVLGFYKQNPLLAFFLTILIVCVVGFLSWHLVEKRFLAPSRVHVQQQN